MTTAAAWINETEQHLGIAGGKLDKLAAAMSDTTTGSLTVTYGNQGIEEGSVITVDLEVMYVWAFNPTTKVATVERGFAGSTAATHLVSSLVFVNPVFTKFAIFTALNQELESAASAGLFKMSTVELTFLSSAAMYDLTSVTNIEGIYRVDARYTELTDDWARIHRWTIARDQDTDDFPSGLALAVFDGGQPGQPVRVQYKSRFTALTSLASTKASTNLPSSAFDIPPLGAAARLVETREVPRNDIVSQGDSRRADEVPPGAVRSAAAGLWARRNTRLAEERTALLRRYPKLQPVV